jgi:serine O-acetyltransferase
MKFSIKRKDLFQYTINQINCFFLDGNRVTNKDLDKYADDTINRLSECFKEIKKPYYYNCGKNTFNHLHGDHYAMFLYILSNTIWVIDRNEVLASKVFLLNKALHGIDAFYSIKLPEVFLFVHPVGTVLGNAKYSDYFVVYQNCSVGATEELIYPTFKGETILFSKSTVIGNCNIGLNTILGANSFIINTDIKNNSIVVNSYPNHNILENDKNVIDRMFR